MRILLILILCAVLSCTKEKQAGNKVQFKGMGSEYVTISNGVFNVGEVATSFSGSGRNWESAEISIPDSVHEVNITISGSIQPGYSGNLKAQILINGELKEEETTAQTASSAVIIYLTHSF